MPTGRPLPEHTEPAWTVGGALRLARLLLAASADRWAHSRLTAGRAAALAHTVAPGDRRLLLAGAWLHDTGYGGLSLRRIGAPPRLAALVAHHCEARLIADARGLGAHLDAFETTGGSLPEALAFADMTAGHTGQPMSVPDRLSDIIAGHQHDPPTVLLALREREALLLAAVRRVVQRRRALMPTRLLA